MDSRGNIKPLDQFPEDEREAAQERLKKFVEVREKLLKEMLTPEAKSKLDRIESKLERRILYGQDDE